MAGIEGGAHRRAHARRQHEQLHFRARPTSPAKFAGGGADGSWLGFAGWPLACLIHSFVRVLQVDPGFRPSQCCSSPVLSLPETRYNRSAAGGSFIEQLLTASAAPCRAFSRHRRDGRFRFRKVRRGVLPSTLKVIRWLGRRPQHCARSRSRKPGFLPKPCAFRYCAGANFVIHDNAKSTPVVIVSQSFAK